MKTVTIKKPEKTNIFEIENGDQLKELINDGEYPFVLFDSGKLYPIGEISYGGVWAKIFKRNGFASVYYSFKHLSQKIVIFSHEELGELAKK